MKLGLFYSLVVMAMAMLAFFSPAASAGRFIRKLHDDETDSNETEKPDPIIVEVWTKPVMDWDAETGAEEGPNIKLFQILKDVKAAMGDAIEFDMNSYINSGDGVCSKLSDSKGNPLDPSAKAQVCDASCANGHRYCEPPPMDPKHTEVTQGNLLLEEALRRQCIWQLVNKQGDWQSTQKYFDYVINLRLVECDAKGYRKLCINNVLGLVGVGGNPVLDCTSQSGGTVDDKPNSIFDSLVEKQKKKNIDSLQQLPAVFVQGVLQKDVSTLLGTLCKEVPKQLRPSDVCDSIVDALGNIEDENEGEKAKETLMQEIAGELAENPKEFKGENASQLENQLEKEEIADGEGTQEDETKLDENFLAQDQTKLGTSIPPVGDGLNMTGVNEKTIQQQEEVLEEAEEEKAGVEPDADSTVGQSHAVVEVWTTPLLDWNFSNDDMADGPNMMLFDHLRSIVTDFGNSVDFRPQPYLFSKAEVCTINDQGLQMSPSEADTCADANCANHHRYCGMGLSSWKVTGQSMVQESLRRLCIWEEYGRGDAGAGAEVFFDYLNNFHAAKCDTAERKDSCLTNLFTDLKIDADKVNLCMMGSGGLEADVSNSILEPLVQLQRATFFFHKFNPMEMPFVLVDGVPLGGANVLVKDLRQVLCAKFPSNQPNICKLSDLVIEEKKEEKTSEDTEQKPSETDLSATKAGASLAPISEAPSLALLIAETQAPSLASAVASGDAADTLKEPELHNATEVPLESEDTQVPKIPLTSSPFLASEVPAASLPLASEAPVVSTYPIGSEAQGASQYPQDSLALQPQVSASQDVGSGVNVETSSPQTVWSLSAHTPETMPPTHVTAVEDKAGEMVAEEALTVLPTANVIETAVPSVKDLVTATGSTTSILGALDSCGVDASLVISKVLALTEGNLKKEIEKIESDLPVFMSETCPHKEGADILHRMEEFHVCAKFDLQALIETFPSTATGVALRCANAYSNMTKEEEQQGFIPEACIRTMEADSYLGRAIFGLYLYPDTACPCFEKLGNSIPECSVDVWPIPINGALVKVESCMVAQYCKTVDGLCEKNLEILSECLPPLETNPKAMSCPKIFEECSALYSKVPPILTAAPLPDACIRIAEGSKFYGKHVVERYSAFRKRCGKNIELWEGHTPIAEFKSFVAQGMLGIDYTSVPFVSGAGAGFAAGVLFCIVFVIVRNICICICRCCRNCWRRCCCASRSPRGKKLQRPTTEDYATVETEGDEVPEYRD